MVAEKNKSLDGNWFSERHVLRWWKKNFPEVQLSGSAFKLLVQGRIEKFQPNMQSFEEILTDDMGDIIEKIAKAKATMNENKAGEERVVRIHEGAVMQVLRRGGVDVKKLL